MTEAIFPTDPIYEEQTSFVAWDKLMISNSQDGYKVYRISANRFKWDTWEQGEQWIQWEQWPQWEQWIQGLQWEQGDSIVWKGEYNALTTYSPLDWIYYNGSSYVCILESTGNLPTNTTYFDLLAEWCSDDFMRKDVYDPAWWEKQVAFDDEVVKLDQTTPQTITWWQPIQNTLTASEIVATDWDKKLSSLPVATYPSLTELTYVKGVTSGIQSQLNWKQDSLWFTPEDSAKRTSFQATPTDTAYPSEKLVKDSLDAKISASSTDTLTNKTINADNNTISNIEVDNLKSGVLDTDLSSVSASDDTIPSAKATKAMWDTKLPLSWWTMTGKTVPAGTAEVAKTYTPATWSQTVTIDCNVNNQHIVTGHSSWTAITFAVSNVTNNQIFSITIIQWTTPSTIAWRFSTIKRPWWTAPTLTATAGKKDTFVFIRTGTNTYDGFVVWQNL